LLVSSIDYPAVGVANAEQPTEAFRYAEPGGNHTGMLTLTVAVHDDVILQEETKGTGDWTFWDPAGTINARRRTN
jgi:hypothetical protein